MEVPFAVNGIDSVDRYEGGDAAFNRAYTNYERMLIAGVASIDVEAYHHLVHGNNGSIDSRHHQPSLGVGVGGSATRIVVEVHGAHATVVSGGDVRIGGVVVRAVSPALRSVNGSTSAPVVEGLGVGEYVDKTASGNEVGNEGPAGGIVARADTANVNVVNGAVLETGEGGGSSARNGNYSTLTVSKAGRTELNLELGGSGVNPCNVSRGLGHVASHYVGRTRTSGDVGNLNVVEVAVVVAARDGEDGDVLTGTMVAGERNLEVVPSVRLGDDCSSNLSKGCNVRRIGHHTHSNAVAGGAVSELEADLEAVDTILDSGEDNTIGTTARGTVEVHTLRTEVGGNIRIAGSGAVLVEFGPAGSSGGTPSTACYPSFEVLIERNLNGNTNGRASYDSFKGLTTTNVAYAEHIVVSGEEVGEGVAGSRGSGSIDSPVVLGNELVSYFPRGLAITCSPDNLSIVSADFGQNYVRSSAGNIAVASSEEGYRRTIGAGIYIGRRGKTASSVGVAILIGVESSGSTGTGRETIETRGSVRSATRLVHKGGNNDIAGTIPNVRSGEVIINRTSSSNGVSTSINLVAYSLEAATGSISVGGSASGVDKDSEVLIIGIAGGPGIGDTVDRTCNKTCCLKLLNGKDGLASSITPTRVYRNATCLRNTGTHNNIAASETASVEAYAIPGAVTFSALGLNSQTIVGERSKTGEECILGVGGKSRGRVVVEVNDFEVEALNFANVFVHEFPGSESGGSSYVRHFNIDNGSTLGSCNTISADLEATINDGTIGVELEGDRTGVRGEGSDNLSAGTVVLIEKSALHSGGTVIDTQVVDRTFRTEEGTGDGYQGVGAGRIDSIDYIAVVAVVTIGTTVVEDVDTAGSNAIGTRNRKVDGTGHCANRTTPFAVAVGANSAYIEVVGQSVIEIGNFYAVFIDIVEEDDIFVVAVVGIGVETGRTVNNFPCVADSILPCQGNGASSDAGLNEVVRTETARNVSEGNIINVYIIIRILAGEGFENTEGNVTVRAMIAVEVNLELAPVGTIVSEDGINTYEGGVVGRIGHHTNDNLTGVVGRGAFCPETNLKIIDGILSEGETQIVMDGRVGIVIEAIATRMAETTRRIGVCGSRVGTTIQTLVNLTSETGSGSILEAIAPGKIVSSESYTSGPEGTCTIQAGIATTVSMYINIVTGVGGEASKGNNGIGSVDNSTITGAGNDNAISILEYPGGSSTHFSPGNGSRGRSQV